MMNANSIRFSILGFICMSLIPLQISAQAERCTGQVLTPDGTPQFAANVYWLSDPQQGTITNSDGEFSLSVLSDDDSLIIRYPGFETLTIAAAGCTQELTLILSRPDLTLTEVDILARTTMAEQFSVRRLEQMDIYLDPFAAADPLRAITSLPASTNADESANPVLRGSAADLSQIILNGVPVYQPVRNSQLNGIGNFSLFNTDILKQQDVYASNPPLIYGNVAAGLVDIQTTDRRPNNSWRIAASMANIGLFRTQQLPGKGFAQIYGNHQFSNFFIGIQPRSLQNLNAFGATDLGVHIVYPIGESWSLKHLSYGISESYSANTQIFNSPLEANGQKRRMYHVTSLTHQGTQGIFSVNMGQNQSATNLELGALNADRKRSQSYYAINYKRFSSRKISWQTGLNYDTWRDALNDTMPALYYAFEAGAPTTYVDTTIGRNLLEGYGYLKIDPSEKLHLAAGIRTGMNLQQASTPYLSAQGSARWDFARHRSVLLSAGQYHSFLPVGIRRIGFSRIQSRQISLDYQYQTRQTILDLAVFHKTERGLQSNGELFVNRTTVTGVEAAVRQELGEFFSVNLANTWIMQRIQFTEEGPSFPGVQDFPYFLKAAVAFRHPSFVDATITGIFRPGQLYNPILAGQYQSELDRFSPIYSSDPNSERLPSYQNISVAISRYLAFPSGSLVLFLNVNNVLDRLNPQALWYNDDFSEFEWAPFSRRTVYAGLVWEWR